MISLVFKVRMQSNLGFHLIQSENESNLGLQSKNAIQPSQILAHLPLSAVGAMEQVCRHLRTVIIHAR